ncbi:tissue factor pathway inhibitor isoform X2 [Gallus gallus]|uniref:Tissue factor pathway inhibitor n=1 Tax=Gallus gallus TaxID=9031 RepID=A0A8V0YJQ3_CHICK|nr:tissue factor pathway inhibitor isoform X2 [Gallus gallus]XP_046799952.1 tissue factor pathway inhibitor isoform X2 [Gallus gallus]XP_046799953.1 tissue factor pathway inhibitor isoform X2 [Gallus gallus]XP_046799954.1 tissue factor pathway inhibitor isoform X2 [Gallus gallus]XP_046799955.1 tissue factor pathway inhibitor isoform X2 [Gallus gallus]XP_046799956.1 tissue factor pathway inhibitor isoform X2 [Gallus gallus]XP_046799957.1 tissue factor pathway inhibitor isoform X2 [Gallus gallu
MRKMKGRKRGCFLPLTFVLLFVCITGHATDDSDGEEEDVLGVPLPPLKLGHSDCALKADEGPCKAIHVRFYFNIQSRECEIFEYGGCHGNANNFLTLEECQNKCVVTELPLEVMLAKNEREKPNFCYQEKDPGICRGFFSRYFYNKETKICEIFKYGGCLGNQNNFKSLEECQTTCQGNPNLLSVAPDEEHPNHMNSSSPEEERNQFPGIVEPPPIPSLCMTPMDRGLCRAKETRFFYNYSTGRCRPFTYSGCGGNENNFTSRKSCLRICRKGFIKKKDGRRLIRIKKKKKQLLKTKTVGEETIHGRIQF